MRVGGMVGDAAMRICAVGVVVGGSAVAALCDAAEVSAGTPPSVGAMAWGVRAGGLVGEALGETVGVAAGSCVAAGDCVAVEGCVAAGSRVAVGSTVEVAAAGSVVAVAKAAVGLSGFGSGMTKVAVAGREVGVGLGTVWRAGF